MDLAKVFVSENDFPENKEEVINDILNRIYSQEDTTFQWENAQDFMFWGTEDKENFIFLDDGSDGKHWDLNGGTALVIQRYDFVAQVDFESWYAAIKEKFKI